MEKKEEVVSCLVCWNDALSARAVFHQLELYFGLFEYFVTLLLFRNYMVVINW